jgi:hypothetical protein
MLPVNVFDRSLISDAIGERKLPWLRRPSQTWRSARQINGPGKSGKGNRQENSDRRAANDVTAGFAFRFRMFVLGFTDVLRKSRSEVSEKFKNLSESDLD